MKKTPWFEGSVKLVRKGVYERLSPDMYSGYRSEWTGSKWVTSYRERSMFQDLPWRGLAADPTISGMKP